MQIFGKTCIFRQCRLRQITTPTELFWAVKSPLKTEGFPSNDSSFNTPWLVTKTISQQSFLFTEICQIWVPTDIFLGTIHKGQVVAVSRKFTYLSSTAFNLLCCLAIVCHAVSQNPSCTVWDSKGQLFPHIQVGDDHFCLFFQFLVDAKADICFETIAFKVFENKFSTRK